jgi:hypothetical protein
MMERWNSKEEEGSFSTKIRIKELSEPDVMAAHKESTLLQFHLLSLRPG